MKGFNSSEEFFWMILDHLEQGVALFNFNLECLFRNQLMARLWQRFTGKPEKEFADQIALKAQVPSAIRNELIKFRSLTQEQTALRRVIKLTSSSGEEFFLILKTIIYHGDQFYLVFFHEHRRRFENLHTILQEQKGLTSQEIRVVEALWRGLSIKEIARELHIEVSTVKSYLQVIFEKLGVHRQVELMAYLQRLIQ